MRPFVIMFLTGNIVLYALTLIHKSRGELALNNIYLLSDRNQLSFP